MNYYPENEEQFKKVFGSDIRSGVKEGELSSDFEEKSRKIILDKVDAYVDRFGEDGVNTQDGYFLTSETYAIELDRAKSLMSDKGMNTWVGFVPYGLESGSPIGLEIRVNSRRFSIPCDGYSMSFDNVLGIGINTNVVSVLEQESWPSWLNAKINDEAILDEAATNDVYDLNPETIAMLKKLSNGALIDEFRDLAIRLGLGDKIKVNKDKFGMIDSITKALKNFNVNGEDDLKKILNLVGLKIIKTSDRLEPILDSGQSRPNDKTEVDSLIEAIKRIGLL